MTQTQTEAEVLERIRTAVLEVTPASAIYLFGSLAEGRARPDSDYDVLIVTDDPRRPFEIRGDIRSRLSDHYVPMDLLLVTNEAFEWQRLCVNTIPFVAVRRGVRLDG
ncbi:MAG: nucleotidyltransferase domain-containing protein [Candidatus Poribacteria bacterium]|nr:nucleotidyltransferase domain-containing protein [Candidatus Poribacteria bacterium]